MIHHVNLTSYNPNVAGRFKKGDWIISLLDASNGSFNTNVPDARETKGVVFTYKRREDTTSNAITFVLKNGQKIDGYI